MSPDGKQAISASWDKTLKIWDLKAGTQLRTLTGHSGPVLGVAVSPDGASRHQVVGRAKPSNSEGSGRAEADRSAAPALPSVSSMRRRHQRAR
jgi:WD40 repeat protein